MEIQKIGFVGIITVVFAIQMRQSKPEFSFYIIMGSSAILLTGILSYFYGIMDTIYEFRSYLGEYESYTKLLFKVIGITYICDFCANICKDAGYSSIAAQIELGGKLTIFMMGVPILLTLMENIKGYWR